MSFDGDESWVILSPIELSIKRKIESIGVPLKDWNISINYGIKTGFNEAFIISGEKKDELISQDPKSAEIIRPILRGRDIKRYDYEFDDLWIIATFPSRKYNIDDFPAVKKHLLSFGIERLEQTGQTHIVNGEKIKSRKKTNNKWFETQDSISYWDDFSKRKIVWGNLCLSAQYSMVEEEYYINAPSPMLINGDKYLLAMLNSNVVDWYIRNLGVTRNGGYFEYKPMFVEMAPIPHIENEMKEIIIKYVDEIQLRKSKKINTELIENELNQVVYRIYGLSEIEIAYFESKLEITSDSASDNP
ncbi:TaqI-like C-terminal specificity domain-containing protein [Ruminococcus sp.]|uniref:TaqI-like C-terminal specificity domain-containing protein n=1 Tax=Ruminococcus sp. TaxID=41978 RepID=UPI0025DFA77F|nr:TaqI-like C-terminal specificity domain-containing protein [Ruminococcus sp.]